jgi:hypothetical protein
MRPKAGKSYLRAQYRHRGGRVVMSRRDVCIAGGVVSSQAAGSKLLCDCFNSCTESCKCTESWAKHGYRSTCPVSWLLRLLVVERCMHHRWGGERSGSRQRSRYKL